MWLFFLFIWQNAKQNWCCIMMGFSFGYLMQWILVTLQMVLPLSDSSPGIHLKMSIASLYLSSCRLMSDQICKIISRVSCFIDCRSLEKICHKNEKTLSDSALDKGAVRQISRTCNKLWIPKSCPMHKNIGQHLSEDDFETSYDVIMENFKLLLQVVVTAIIRK